METSKSHIFYFVENLTWISWLFYVLPALKKQRQTASLKKSRVYYIDADRYGVFIANLTVRWLQVEIEQLNFRMVDIRDDEGSLLRLRIAYQDMAELQQQIISNTDFQNLLKNKAVIDRMPNLLTKQYGLPGFQTKGSFIRSRNLSLWRAIYLIQIAVWFAKQQNAQDAKSTFFILRRVWWSEIKNYGEKYNVQVRPINKDYLIDIGLLLLQLKRVLPRQVKGKIRLLQSWIRQRKEQSKPPSPQLDISSLLVQYKSSLNLLQNSTPKLAVEYYAQFNLNQPELHCDLFFWQQSSFSSQDLILLFNQHRDPFDEKKLVDVMAHGITPVVLDYLATTIPSFPVFPMVPHAKKMPLSNWPNNTVEQHLLQAEVDDYYTLRNYWIELFTAYNIKLYTSWYRYDANNCVIADTLQQVGGVSTLYQRAFEEFPSPETTIAVDVFFGFSSKGIDLERGAHSVIPYYITTGYLGDHRFPLLHQQAQAVRHQLQQAGAKQILAFFDENSGNDDRWHTGHRFMRVNYQFLLEKVLSEPWFGLVLKPKIPSTLRRRLGPVAELLTQAEATGRCFVFGGGPLHGSYPPVAAALVADVAIHGHLCAATAGVESALAGKPTLLIDREGWPISSLYDLGLGKVVFTEWDALWDVYMEHQKLSSGVPGFGDWSTKLHEFDPFRDGQAAERMGTYLQWLIEGFKSGLDREVVMADAAERYAKAWGWDKVGEVKPVSFLSE